MPDTIINGIRIVKDGIKQRSPQIIPLHYPSERVDYENTTVKATLDRLKTVAFSNSYNDLDDKPTIPTVNNATLTIQKNGTTIKTFTANASSDVTANITVPTKVSELDNDKGFITSASLPTVNNATLTIQKNGTTVKTFTANSASDVTCNITMTKSDVGLGNVENKSSATIRSELTKLNVTTALGYTPPTTDTNTTYSFSEGSTNGAFVVTPSSGSASTVKVHGLGSLAYKNSLSKSDVGLGNVDNTADANKSVKSAVSCTNAEYVTNLYPVRYVKSDSSQVYKMATSENSGVRIIDPKGLMICDTDATTPNLYKNMAAVTCSLINCRGRHPDSGTQYDASINFMNSENESAGSKASLTLTGTSFNLLSTGSISMTANLGNVTIIGPDVVLTPSGGLIYCGAALQNASGGSNGFYIRDNLGLGVVKASNSSVFSDIYCAVLHDGASSRRFKENIQDLTEAEAKKILDVRTVTFDFRENSGIIDNERRLNHRGVIAEEVKDLIPSVVSYRPNDDVDENGNPIPYSVQYSQFVPYLIKMVQILKKEIDDLKAVGHNS